MSDLIDAAEKGHIEDVERLIDLGTDIDIQNKAGNTALILAVANRKRDVKNSQNDEVVDKLIRAGADTFIRNKAGNTAFMIAAKN